VSESQLIYPLKAILWSYAKDTKCAWIGIGNWTNE